MAIIKPNNNTLSSITALPAAIPTGKVLQTVSATDSTSRTTTSGSYVTASNTLSVDITPSSSSNKVLIMFSSGGQSNTDSKEARYTIYRDSTNIGNGGNGFLYINKNQPDFVGATFLDTPSTTSQITYQVYIKAESGYTIRLNAGSIKGSIVAMEIGA